MRRTEDVLVEERNSPTVTLVIIARRIVHHAHGAEERLPRRRAGHGDRAYCLRSQLQRFGARGRGGRAVEADVALYPCGENVWAIGVDERGVDDGVVACKHDG